MIKRIIQLLFVILCISCDENKKTEIGQFPVEEYYIDNKENSLLSPDDFTVDKVVELKSRENLNVVNCHKFIIHNDLCYVLDRSHRKIFVFDEQGNMINTLGRIGHAKDEIIKFPTDFLVDKETNELYLFESFSNKIIIYDSSGEYKSTFTFDNIHPRSFTLSKSGNFIFAFGALDDIENGTPELAVYDKKIERISSYFPFTKNQTFTLNFPFVNYYDKNAFLSALGENLYILDGDTISSCVHFSFKSPYLSESQKNEVLCNSNLAPFSQDKSSIHYIDSFSENEYWRYIKYASDCIYYYLRNNSTGKTYHGTNLFTAYFPYCQIVISGDKLVLFVSSDYVDLIKSSKDQRPDDFQMLYNASCETVQKLLDGELKAPCLVYLTIP